MSLYQSFLNTIASNQEAMSDCVMAWSAINSGSFHSAGLTRMAQTLTAEFGALAEVSERIALAPMQRVTKQGALESVPLNDMLRFRTRPNAPIQVLLVGHYDTVFGAEHAFQTPRVESGTIVGPGAADLKGGLVVMLEALRVLESSPWRENLGWEVLLNPDEEIGSPGSAPWLCEAAKRHHLGLVYEPAMADGVLAGARKGSGNFTWVVRGRAAHAGRDIELGRNAIVALAELTGKLAAQHGARPELTINPGVMFGGTVVNTVPDLAQLSFNIRMRQPEDMAWAEDMMDGIAATMEQREGYLLERHGRFTRPPKPLTPGILYLFDLLRDCGEQLDMPIAHRPSGGVCDGNNLAAAGLPNIDTLGVVGGNLHSDQEFMLISSLKERAQLSALLLLRLASGELTPPPK